MIALRSLPRIATALLPVLLAVSFAAARPAGAQEPADEPASAAERDRLFDELARDVDALERRLSIVKRVVRLVEPTVVHIEAKKSQNYQLQYGSRAEIEEAGSGIVVELKRKLYILTNRHVIKFADPSDITIRLSDGRETHPRRFWEDPQTDVAVLDVDGSALTGIPAARVGDSDRVEIGDFVLAVGSPFGLSQSVTYGIVSAKGRYDLDLGDGEVDYQNFIQTDAAINPGNSGGPLINLRGEVIGLNTAIASNSGGNEGIGFSIPVNLVMHIAGQLAENGKVARAFLGVGLDAKYIVAASSGGQPLGARVTRITSGSPAEAAGIQAGDVILAFNGVRIRDDSHLINMVGVTAVGREVEVVLRRDGRITRLKARVGDKADFPPNLPR